MSHNPEGQRVNDSKRKGHLGSDQTKVCHNCGKTGHIKRACKRPKTTTPRQERNNDAIHVSAADLAAQNAGLKEAINDMRNEKEDARAAAVLQEAVEADHAQHLKAEAAGAAMMRRIAVGTTFVSALVLTASALSIIVVSFLYIVAIASIRTICLPFRLPAIIGAAWRIFLQHAMPGNGASPHLRMPFGLTYLLILLMAAFCTLSISHPSSLVLLYGLAYVSMVFLELRKLRIPSVLVWKHVFGARLCPKELWLRASCHTLGPSDLRDDTVNSLPLRHTYDEQVNYDVYHPGFIVRCLVDYTSPLVFCISALLGRGARTGDDYIDEVVTYLCVPTTLVVSASLARQARTAKNVPSGLALSQVEVLVESFAAHEGYSNVSSFMENPVLCNLRLNTSKYVVAETAERRELLASAGFVASA